MGMIYHRKNKQMIEEQEVGGKSLRFLYQTVLGRLILKQLVGPSFSNWKARQNSKPKSAKKIQVFVEKYQIDLTEAKKTHFDSFQDFFTRELKPEARPIHPDPNSVIAVADGKITAYPITMEGSFRIKESVYTIEELLRDKETAAAFIGGTCFVYRLSMDDYHRFIYPASGNKIKEKMIPGVLHTVRPLAHRYTKVFAENTRQWQLLETEIFGPILYMEVGAMLVGKIHDHGHLLFEKGQEKGYFEYGASSIVVCYPAGKVKVDEDIQVINQKGIEVQVRLGEKVGEFIC